MKKVLFIIGLFITSISFAQKINHFPNEFPPIFRTSLIFPYDCSVINPPICNYIRNNNFDHPNYNYQIHMADPFGLEVVPEWNPASGSPTIFDNNIFNDPVPPAGTTGYAFAASTTYESSGVHYDNEGIVQKIPNLIPGHIYVMSFFKAKKDYSAAPIPTNFPIDKFSIRFINCAAYNATFNPSSYDLPPVPVNNQQVYCETVVDHVNWQQVLIHFTATSNYNMIWIYPEENQVLGRHAGLHFAYPELIDITAIQNQVIPATQPGCMATLPNCGPINSTFTWEGPWGQILSAPTGQAIQIDVTNSQNVGTWIAMEKTNLILLFFRLLSVCFPHKVFGC